MDLLRDLGSYLFFISTVAGVLVYFSHFHDVDNYLVSHLFKNEAKRNNDAVKLYTG